MREALARKESLESHRHLQRARKVPGFGQGRAALDFGWQLLETLKRDRLEAVWERLSIQQGGPLDIDLHPTGRRFLFCLEDTVHLALDQDGRALTVWTITRPDPLLLVRFLQRGEESYVLTVDIKGQAALHDPADGRVINESNLAVGPLAKAMLHGSTPTFLGRAGGMGQYDLFYNSYFAREVADQPRLFAPWQRGKVLISTAQRLGVLDLTKPGSEMERLRLGLEITKVPSFLEHLPERGLLVLGFPSGKLRILDVNGAGVLATLAHGEGNLVTSFVHLAKLDVALTTTASGQIFFWDLRTEEPLDEFIVHRHGVSQLRASRSGRYLLTSGKGGIVRYWETSWTIGELREKEGSKSIEGRPIKSRSVRRLSQFLGRRS